MSFDTVFNYTPMVNRLTSKIETFETTIKEIIAHTDDTQKHIYDNKRAAYEKLVEDYNTTIDEIEFVESLPDSDKLILYQFYLHSRSSLHHYMRVIAHSHARMLKDVELIELCHTKVTNESMNTCANILSRYSDSDCV